VTVPWPSRIRGQVRLHPNALTHYSANLDSQGQHRWHPISPCARVDVKLQSPALRWSGAGYFDRNEGTVPLESSLVSWDWSRTQLREGTAVIYDVTPRYGRSVALALHFDRLGRACDLISPPLVQLPRSKWGIRRSVRAGDGQAEVLRTVEDTPFYARSLLSSRFLGEQVKSIHESLDLDRFSKLWVQAMLPFRMPRSLR
jgi:carotenoid 1,2-hydratase